jgi:hypothetical protein
MSFHELAVGCSRKGRTMRVEAPGRKPAPRSSREEGQPAGWYVLASEVSTLKTGATQQVPQFHWPFPAQNSPWISGLSQSQSCLGWHVALPLSHGDKSAKVDSLEPPKEQGPPDCPHPAMPQIVTNTAMAGCRSMEGYK